MQTQRDELNGLIFSKEASRDFWKYLNLDIANIFVRFI